MNVTGQPDEPHDFEEEWDGIEEEEHEMMIECENCGGNGTARCCSDMGTFAMDCPECGGTGWY